MMSAYRCCVALVTGLCCLGLWLAPAVPMQDYPQHMFISAVVRGGAHAAWSHDYEVSLTLSPYSGLYWLWSWIASVAPWGLDVAGRVFITSYFGLFALLAFRLERDAQAVPWAALWLFPFALNQAYFHGYLNYLWTLPLLLLGLHQLRGSATRAWRPGDLAWHTLLLLLIVWFHPYTLYVYAGLAACDLALTRAAQTPLRWRSAPLVLVLGLLVIWQAVFFRDSGQLRYWPLSETIAYFGQMFLGMRASPSTALWHALGYAGVVIALVRSRVLRSVDRRDLGQLGLVAVAYFALPYQVGSYSAFNWRLAPLLYLLLALALARVRLPKPSAWIVAAVAVVFSGDAAYLQVQVGRECAEILPLAQQVAPQRYVVALSIDASSRWLHPRFFYLMHRHDIFYYQLQSGALSPHLWRVPLIPVHYKPSVRLREPRSVQDVVAQGYPCVFVRGATPALARALGRSYVPRRQSGAWVVFERRGPDDVMLSQSSRELRSAQVQAADAL